MRRANAVAGGVAGPDTSNGATVISTPITLVNNSAVSEVAPFVTLTGATYALAPALPTSMQFDASNGSMGTPDMVMAKDLHDVGQRQQRRERDVDLLPRSLEDLDERFADTLPSDYDAVNDPIRTPGLRRTWTMTATVTTTRRKPAPVPTLTRTTPAPTATPTRTMTACRRTVARAGRVHRWAGPDPLGLVPPTLVGVNNTAIATLAPYHTLAGGTYAIVPAARFAGA